MTNRRIFLLATLPAAVGLLATRSVGAQAARLEETDALAVSLGYKHDAAKVDTKKFANYAAGRNCANCQLFQAKGSEPWAGCGAVGGKQVAAKGWCVAWVKKA